MKIAIVSGSRADRGPLEMVRKALEARHRVEWIEFNAERDSGRSRLEAAAFSSWVMRHVASLLPKINPDLVVLLGDRYEILATALAVNVMGSPIAHLSGGDVTEGSQDEAYRHAITKLSHLHFATSEESARRIVQMGEDPRRVFDVGCPGVDRILRTTIVSKAAALAWAGIPRCINYVLGCLHPNTVTNTADELREFIAKLESLDDDVGIVLIGPNGDPGADMIRERLKFMAGSRNNAVFHDHLEGSLYLSLMKHAAFFIGNSSAVYYEAPTLGTRVVEIGDRQKGRVPHTGDGQAAERIANLISTISDPRALLRKGFHGIQYRLEPCA